MTGTSTTPRDRDRYTCAGVGQLRENPDSDAGPLVARQLGERFVAMRGVAADAHLAVDTRPDLSTHVDEVAPWLDSPRAAGRSA